MALRRPESVTYSCPDHGERKTSPEKASRTCPECGHYSMFYDYDNGRD